MLGKFEVDDGTRLNLRLDGPDDGAPLILSNSLGTDRTMWDDQIPALSRNFRIARYDTRGHGDSDIPVNGYTIDRLGRDVLAIADHLGWERFDFAGVSMGAMTGLWLGINAPSRLGRLVLANGGPFAGGPVGWAERAAAVRAGGIAAIADGVVHRWFTADFASREPQVVAKARAALLATPPEGYAGCCTALGAMDLRPGLAGIVAPALLIGGAHDMAPPPTVIETLATQLPDARALILEAAHLSNIEAADAFRTAMMAFLQA